MTDVRSPGPEPRVSQWPESMVCERLVLRSICDCDRAWLVELQMNSMARRYLGGARDSTAAEAAMTEMAAFAWGLVVVEEHDAQRVGVVVFDDHRGDLEVSYVFHPDHWKRGFASEALRAALSWVAAHGRPAVIAVTQVANLPSRRLLDRLGFVEEARFVEFDEPQVQLRWKGSPAPEGNVLFTMSPRPDGSPDVHKALDR